MAITLHGRITENGKLEVDLPPGLESGDVTVRIEPDRSSVAWTEEELQAILDAAPKTPQELVNWLANTPPPAEQWGNLPDDADAADYVHWMRRRAQKWQDEPSTK